MNVNGLYNNTPYLNGGGKVQRQLPQEKRAIPQLNETINTNEVQFFKNLFPANAKQIENYVSFNRSGAKTSVNLSKGSLLDAKI